MIRRAHFNEVLIFMIVCGSALAQTVTTGGATVTTGTAPAAATPSPVAASLVGTSTSDGHPIFSLGLNWNESLRHVSVEIPNNFGSAVTVLGVQATGGLFITAFPSSIPANANGDFHVLVVAPVGGEASSDFVRVMTSGGLLTAELQHNRASVFQVSPTFLQWSVGSAASSQTVTLTVTPGTTVPIGVQASGPGNTAVLSQTGAQQYTITVTPGSTAAVETFPVTIQFNPTLPGVSSVIPCSVR
jgi:hypothetical protein